MQTGALQRWLGAACPRWTSIHPNPMRPRATTGPRYIAARRCRGYAARMSRTCGRYARAPGVDRPARPADSSRSEAHTQHECRHAQHPGLCGDGRSSSCVQHASTIRAGLAPPGSNRPRRCEGNIPARRHRYRLPGKRTGAGNGAAMAREAAFRVQATRRSTPPSYLPRPILPAGKRPGGGISFQEMRGRGGVTGGGQPLWKGYGQTTGWPLGEGFPLPCPICTTRLFIACGPSVWSRRSSHKTISRPRSPKGSGTAADELRGDGNNRCPARSHKAPDRGAVPLGMTAAHPL
jgi:hypothetical protein